MRISVVSPSFNQASFIDRTITSVAKQTHQDKQHIIVDGCSTDGSIDRIKLAAESYYHVEALIEPDRGQSDAINKGFQRASGDILCWLNTDDFFYDDHVLEKISQEFSQNPHVDVIYGRGNRLDACGNVIREAWINRQIFSEWDFWKSLGILQPSLFFRRHVFDTVGGLDETYSLQLDYDYWIRMAKNGFTFLFIDELLSNAVVHVDAKSTRDRQRQLSECITMIHRHYGEVPPEWFHRLAEFYVTGLDQKIQTEKTLLNEGAKEAMDSIAKFTRYAVATPDTLAFKSSRVIITAFDSQYFNQGINLIASLYRTSFLSFDEIIVYPLDLSEREISFLNKLHKVTVAVLPSTPVGFPDFFEPKGRAYKTAIICGENIELSDGALVLWLDAGISMCMDVNDIFEIIEKEEFFITNHDDSRHWPIYNIQFIHEKALDVLQCSVEELVAPHLCSAIVGYKRGGKFQHVIHEARRLGRIRTAVMWPKIPSEAERRKFPRLSKPEFEELRKEALAKRISPTDLRRRSPFYGHRTQAIYSVLCKRYDAPMFSSSVYRQGNEVSTEASHRNWLTGAKETDGISTQSALDGLTRASRAFHHRGTYTNLIGLLTTRFFEPVFVVGNGPSLREFDFEKLRGRAWVGMNAAYRFWDTIGIYPYIYCCLDTVVQESHKEEIWRLICNKKNLGIEFFFLRRDFVNFYPESAGVDGVFFLEDLQRHVEIFDRGKITTGSFSVYFCFFLGFFNIALLGIDLNYVERIEESEVVGRELVISQEVQTNPNYFFDGYQKPGDRYNPPNRHAGMHLRSWDEAADVLSMWGVRVVNCNANSAVRKFPFSSADAVMSNWESDLNAAMYAAQTFDALIERQNRFRNDLLGKIGEDSEWFYPSEEQAVRSAAWYRRSRYGREGVRGGVLARERRQPESGEVGVSPRGVFDSRRAAGLGGDGVPAAGIPAAEHYAPEPCLDHAGRGAEVSGGAGENGNRRDASESLMRWSEADDVLLVSWSSTLLVDRDAILLSLLPGGARAADVERVLSARPDSDRLAVHFQSVLAHAKRAAQIE